MGKVNEATEAAARALAEYRYEHGADCQGLDKFEWAEMAWREMIPEVQIVSRALASVVNPV